MTTPVQKPRQTTPCPNVVCEPHDETHLQGISDAAFSAPLDAQREQLVLAHVPQVRLIARSLWERSRFAVELDDLIGYGMIGLLDAVRKFDPCRGFQLKTYAEHRIRGAILDGLRGMDWLSRSARRQAKTLANMESVVGSRPSSSGCVTSTAVSGEAREPLAKPIPPATTKLFCGGSVNEIERLYQNSRQSAEWTRSAPTPERLLARKQERSALAGAIESLPERQRHVLELYYRRELSMKQIAVLMGVHESRVSQIHLAAIGRLRKSLGTTPSTARPTAAKRLRRLEPASPLALAG